MSSPAFEAFLARLYTDEDLRLRYLASPGAVCRESKLSNEERIALETIDRDGLILAARSYARKRRSTCSLDELSLGKRHRRAAGRHEER